MDRRRSATTGCCAVRPGGAEDVMDERHGHLTQVAAGRVPGVPRRRHVIALGHAGDDNPVLPERD
jgi:hypothetical protein